MKKINANTIFTCIVIFICILFLYFSRNFPERSRLMPFTVSLLVLFLAFIQILFETVPGFKKMEAGKVHFLNEDVQSNQVKNADHCNNRENKKNHLGLYSIIKWNLLVIIGVYLFGFFIALPMFVYLFYLFDGKYQWVRALVITLIFWILVFIFFQVFLNVELFKGIIFL